MQAKKHTKKSFVLRRGRVTAAQRRALNSLKNEYTIKLNKGMLNLAEAFLAVSYTHLTLPTNREV